MLTNKYNSFCSICRKKLPAGEGYVVKKDKWMPVCDSSACHNKLGGTIPEKKLYADGRISMPYDPNAIPLLRSLPGARWNPDGKFWSVSVQPKDLARVLDVAKSLGLETDPTLYSIMERGTVESTSALQRANRKRSDGKELFEFQKKGVEFLALHDRALLADDMGVGKTIQALMAMPEEEQILILCPAAVKYNWRDEIKLWRPEYQVTILSGRNSFCLPVKNEIVIVNYDILPSWLTKEVSKEFIDELAKVTIIADEAHLVKNFKTNRSKNVSVLSKHAKNVWFLTGTPLMNRPMDLFGILRAGSMNPFGSWSNFLRLFNGYQNKWGGFEFGTPSPEVPERMKRVMLRRLKSEVLKDLPSKTYQNIEVDNISKDLSKRMNDFILANAIHEGLLDPEDVDSDMLKDTAQIKNLTKNLELTNLPSFEEFAKIRSELADSRIPEMLEIVETYEEADTPLIVFSAHRNPILELGKRDGWEIITGSTDPETRRNIVHSFQSGKLKGVGLTIQAGGVGLTLTRASHALFVDLDWTPAMNIQAEDRLARIGSKAEYILIKRMVSSHPLDLHMQHLIEYKMKLAYAALEGGIKYEKKEDVVLREETEEQMLARMEKEQDRYQDALTSRLIEVESKINRQMARDKVAAILERESDKVAHIAQPELTPAKKEVLRNALSYMVGHCDGAVSKDGQGFSKADAGIAHWIERTGLMEDDEVTYRVLERILVRYRRQLSGFNIW